MILAVATGYASTSPLYDAMLLSFNEYSNV